MDFSLLNYFAGPLNNLAFILALINGVLHIFFASAVAKDAGHLNKNGAPTILVSGLVWAFATLIGGVIVAAIYWVLHHSKLTKFS